MIRTILLLTVTSLLCGCAAVATSTPDSFYRCDRNGDQEQRVACGR